MKPLPPPAPWLTTLFAAVAVYDAGGPRSWVEFLEQRERVRALRLAVARIAGVRGWPAVELGDGLRVKGGEVGWAEFLCADFVLTHSPSHLFAAASGAEAT